MNAKYENDIKMWMEIYDDWLINVNKKYVMNKWYCDNHIVMFYVRYAAGLLSENLAPSSPHDMHWSFGPRPVKLCSDQ